MKTKCYSFHEDKRRKKVSLLRACVNAGLKLLKTKTNNPDNHQQKKACAKAMKLDANTGTI